MSIALEVLRGDKPLLQSTQPTGNDSLADLMVNLKAVKEKSNEFLTELVVAEKTKQTARAECEAMDDDDEAEEEAEQTDAQDLSCKKQKVA